MYTLIEFLLIGINGSANNQLNFPQDVTFDTVSGTLYVSDSGNHRIMCYPANASSGIVVAGGNGPGTSNTQLNNPIGIYLDLTSNSLFIVNYQSNNVVRWILGGNSWTLVVGDINGASGSSSSLLYHPYDVTLDYLGDVYVADAGNHRIQFYLAGSLNGTTIAGITGLGGGESNLLNSPRSVALDSSMNLYVSDCLNHRVQKFAFYWKP